MFIDELTEVLSMIPYKVWEEVMECTVDEVIVEDRNRSSLFSDSRPQLVVYIKSGITTYVLEGLDSLDQRYDKLLCSWKPYRDLINREIEEYSRLLKEPASYMTFEYTEEEIETRYQQMCEKCVLGSKLKNYVSWLGYKPLLHENSFSNDYLPSENNLKDAALRIIFDMVKAGLKGETYDIILSKYGKDSDDESVEMLDDITKYCKSISSEVMDDDLLRIALQSFLSKERDKKKRNN